MSTKRKNIEWIPLQGLAKIESNLIHYQPIRATEGPREGLINICIIGSNVYFQQGTIDFEVNFGGDDCLCRVVINHQLDPQVFIGFNFGTNAYGMAFLKSDGTWEMIEASGFGHPARTNTWLKTRISVVGRVENWL